MLHVVDAMAWQLPSDMLAGSSCFLWCASCPADWLPGHGKLPGVGGGCHCPGHACKTVVSPRAYVQTLPV